MREFMIGENDANQRVDKFIVKTMSTMPKSLMYKYIRNKKIKVNHKRCEIAQRLMVGDTMQCYISDEFFEKQINWNFLKVPAALDIVYEDDHIILVNKPAGLLAHSDTSEVEDNLADRLLHYLYDQHTYDPAAALSFTPALCHRIDRNTQGIVIAAKSAEALRRMNEKIRNREIDKRYLCIVEGVVKKKQEHIILYHKKLEHNKASILPYPHEGYVEIETAYHVKEMKQQYSLVEVELLTGKSHQIRSVMAYLGHPLLGDVKYGAGKTLRNTQALCAYQVTFSFRDEDEILQALQHKTFTLTAIDFLDDWKRL